jgi:hypothetical protein
MTSRTQTFNFDILVQHTMFLIRAAVYLKSAHILCIPIASRTLFHLVVLMTS